MQDTNGIEIYIVSDYDKSLNELLKINGMTRKDGTDLKSVSITDGELKLPRATSSISAKKVKGKTKEFWALVDYQWRNDGSYISILNGLNSFGNCEISINGIKIQGPFIKSHDFIEDSNGVKFNIGQKPILFDKKEMDSFIKVLFSGKGASTMPLISKFSRAVHSIPTRKFELTGYASAVKWLHSMKQGELIPKLGKGASLSSDIWIDIPYGNVTAKPMMDNNRIIWSLPGKITSVRGEPMPYILVTAKPIKGLEYPFLPIKTPSGTYFITPTIFNDPSSLSNLKGGIDLLL